MTHSSLSASAGLARAALRVWVVTVVSTMRNMATLPSKNEKGECCEIETVAYGQGFSIQLFHSQQLASPASDLLFFQRAF